MDESKSTHSKFVLSLSSFPSHITDVYIDVGVAVEVEKEFQVVLSTNPNAIILGVEANIKHVVHDQRFFSDRLWLLSAAMGPKKIADHNFPCVQFYVTKLPGCSSLMQPSTSRELDSGISWAGSTAGADLIEQTYERLYVERSKNCRQITEAIQTPLITLQELLERIPAAVKIRKLKIDAQGMDLSILRSASSDLLITRVDQIKLETRYPAESRFLYANSDTIVEVLRYMWNSSFPKERERSGFIFTDGCVLKNPHILEYDCLFCQLDTKFSALGGHNSCPFNLNSSKMRTQWNFDFINDAADQMIPANEIDEVKIVKNSATYFSLARAMGEL